MKKQVKSNRETAEKDGRMRKCGIDPIWTIESGNRDDGRGAKRWANWGRANLAVAASRGILISRTRNVTTA